MAENVSKESLQEKNPVAPNYNPPTPGGMLLQLPREIRDEIYAEVFGAIIDVWRQPKDQTKVLGKETALELPEHKFNYAILSTCKLIKVEALVILFDKTTFRFALRKPPYGLVTPLLSSFGQHIKHIKLTYDWPDTCIDLGLLLALKLLVRTVADATTINPCRESCRIEILRS